jgi:hypothetical protein
MLYSIGTVTNLLIIFYKEESTHYILKYPNTVNSELSRVMEGRKVTDNIKPWLKQKQ